MPTPVTGSSRRARHSSHSTGAVGPWRSRQRGGTSWTAPLRRSVRSAAHLALLFMAAGPAWGRALGENGAPARDALVAALRDTRPPALVSGELLLAAAKLRPLPTPSVMPYL